MKLTKYHKMNLFLKLLVGLAVLFSIPGQPVAAAGSSTGLGNLPAAGKTFTVNSTADTPDVDPSNGVCADASAKCTLRAAIMEANFTPVADTIIVPAGVYTLTRPGNDDGALIGDLDITAPLTIKGAGMGVTIVDGNGAVTGDRVFQILATATQTTLSGLTIRNGKRTATFDEGAGLYWDGGGSHLTLKNVEFNNNTGYYGGGLYLNYSAMGDVVDLDHLSLHANSATAAAGGLGVSFGDFATLTLQNSQVYANNAYEGGGVYFTGPSSGDLHLVSIVNSQIYSNTASLSAGLENHSGSATVPVILQGSKLYQNHADFNGGAIGNYGTLDISTTTLDSNTADSNTATTRGGGIYNYEGGVLDIDRSTLSRNTSKTGGGIYSELFIHNASMLMLTNSTLSGNGASRDGAGIYADGGQVKLYNATIAANQVLVPSGTVYSGMGGGVYVSSGVTFLAQNSLIADNSHRYGTAASIPDDCLGTLNSLGYNLIEQTANCTVGGTTTGNITGQDPKLGALQNLGGPTHTQPLLAGSPAIDAGQQPACLGDGASALTADQRGSQRPAGAACDIGAFEYIPALNLNSIGSQDGWVLESTETGGVGGSVNATAKGLRLGDSALNQQYKGILAFDSASLPDNAVILSATLKIKQAGSPTGGNPFSLLGKLWVDLRKGWFGSSSALKPADFQAGPTLSKAASFNATPAGGWYSAALTPAGLKQLNKTGLTQLRLYFALDDNNNARADFLTFFTGNVPAMANRPQLIIQYYVP